jgi:hypothetical protein
VKNDSATVALRAEKSCEDVIDAELGGEERFGNRADRPAADLEADLAHRADLADLGVVAKAHVDCRKARGREPERRALNDPRRQRQPVDQVDASCGARRDSSRSTAFINTEGVVSA